MVYNRTLADGTVLTFGASGWTWHGVFVLQDYETGSLWFPGLSFRGGNDFGRDHLGSRMQPAAAHVFGEADNAIQPLLDAGHGHKCATPAPAVDQPFFNQQFQRLARKVGNDLCLCNPCPPIDYQFKAASWPMMPGR